MAATRGVASGGPYAFLPELARQAEGHGFERLWLAETTQESIVQATVCLLATERIEVGTAITLAFPRSPTITAMAAWDLNELSGDRFILGLGSQVRRIVTERFAADYDPPIPRMAEYVQALQAIWRTARGEETTFEGDVYRITRPGFHGAPQPDRQTPRVYVAAVGPLMTRVAATYADGMLGHGFTSLAYLRDSVVPRVEKALAKAGRDRADFTLATAVIVSVSDDRETAIRDAKAQIGFYGTTPNYRVVFESNDEGHLTDDLRRAWRERSVDALIAAVPDDAVDRYAIAGTPDEVADRLAPYEDLVDHVILGGVWYKVPTSRLAENHWAILETFARR